MVSSFFIKKKITIIISIGICFHFIIFTIIFFVLAFLDPSFLFVLAFLDPPFLLPLLF